jgi:hypothetical protein
VILEAIFSFSVPLMTKALSVGVKRLGSEADHSPPSSAEVNGVELYLHPQYAFVAWCSVNNKAYMDNFTFTFNGTTREVLGHPKYKHAVAE